MVDQALTSVLREFARTMVTDFPVQQILDHLVERIVDILPVTAAGATLIGEDGEARFVAASDPGALHYEQLQTSLDEGPCLLAFGSGEPVTMADVTSEERFPAYTAMARAAGLGAVFAFPLHHGDHRLGALDLYRETSGELDPSEVENAQVLADVAAAYLVNAQARTDARVAAEQHEYQALHDLLTGLPNRALLRDRLEQAGERAVRTHKARAILFVDLDDFKPINDRYGHHVGDALLVAVARRLETVVRPTDTLARVSGDEFVFLCEDLTDRSAAERLANRIDAAFDEPFQLSNLELPLTASIGLAVAEPGETITDQLLVEADTAMYHAKRNRGRDTHRLRRYGLSELDGRSLARQLDSAQDGGGPEATTGTDEELRAPMPPGEDRELAEALAGVARGLVGAGDVQDTLQRIVDLAVQTIPACDHAGLSLVIKGRIETPAQTDPPIPQMIDRIQNETGEGPSVDAIRQHQVFETGDLSDEQRWARFAPAVAAQTEVRSILAIRLFITDDDTMGSIGLYAETVDAFDDADRGVASIFAAHAAVALRAAQQQQQLTTAVKSRDIIGQAKGIIMARKQVDDAAAFALLRDASSRMNRKLSEVAQQVVDRERGT